MYDVYKRSSLDQGHGTNQGQSKGLGHGPGHDSSQSQVQDLGKRLRFKVYGLVKC